jgi:hypothetical protein
MLLLLYRGKQTTQLHTTKDISIGYLRVITTRDSYGMECIIIHGIGAQTAAYIPLERIPLEKGVTPRLF